MPGHVNLFPAKFFVKLVCVRRRSQTHTYSSHSRNATLLVGWTVTVMHMRRPNICIQQADDCETTILIAPPPQLHCNFRNRFRLFSQCSASPTTHRWKFHRRQIRHLSHTPDSFRKIKYTHAQIRATTHHRLCHAATKRACATLPCNVSALMQLFSSRSRSFSTPHGKYEMHCVSVAVVIFRFLH